MQKILIKKNKMKRSFDILLSLLGLILSLPFLITIAILIKTNLKDSVIFKQKRAGKNNKIFYIYKFKTMKNIKDKNGNLLPDEERLTKIGRFLRRISLDELPELLNALKGDMSIVGPRPLLVEYLDRYTPEQARRHEVKPGITGWAQVNGRNAITWEDKFNHDVWYVDNASLWLDIKIMFMTVKNVLRGEDINQPGHATMEKFKGNN